MLRRATLFALALFLFLFLAAAGRVGAQRPDGALYVRDAGPGPAGRVLREALTHPFVMVREPWNTPLYAGRTYETTVVVLNSDATVAGTVRGDVVVINGSLSLTPTARIEGRALAFGGNVYDATGAVVTGRRDAYPATRFDTARTARGLALDFHEPPAPEYDPIHLSGFYGVGVPLYDRVNGISVGWNPELVLGDSAFVLSPSVTYRSNLGLFDGAVTASARSGGAFVRLTGAQATLSNDGWIQTDIANSFMVLCCGKDFRNYWRAEFGDGRVGYVWSDSARDLQLWGGARSEKATSVIAGGPWSITGDSSTYSMLRPNPAIVEGRIESWYAGIGGAMRGNVALQGSVQVEVPFVAPNDARFMQLVADVDGSVPTFKDQDLLFRVHAIYTSGDSAPAQRYGYLGSAGSLPTLGLLSQGGDQLLFVEGDYRFTFEGIRIPYSTPPSIALAYLAGAAGLHDLPRFTQNIGVRLALKPLRLDAFVDPATGEWTTMLLFWFVR